MFSALENDAQNLKVICTGPAFSAMELAFLKKVGVAEKVQHIYVNDQELSELYKCATAFIFPSLYEGFGIPVLEAFSCGCPVLCSFTSSLKEIGEEAVIYFDPKDPHSFKTALHKTINNPDFLSEKVQKGFEQLKKFSWTKTSEDTLKIYKSVLSHS